MKKQTNNKQTYHYLHFPPLHFVVGFYIGVGVALLTALHMSADMIHAIYGNNSVFADTSNSHVREAREFETHSGHAQISMARRSYIGGA